MRSRREVPAVADRLSGRDEDGGRADLAFTDDLRGLSQAEQIARVQAVALEHGDYLTDREVGEALNLDATQVRRPGSRPLPDHPQLSGAGGRMTTGVACPSRGIHLVGDPRQPCYTCQLQAAPGLARELWLRLLLAIDGGEIAVADLYHEPERTADPEAGS
jgi:hypothetical protein